MAAERQESTNRVFAWLLGQDDNVGDTVLRREYANVLRSRGKIIASVGPASDGYIRGLGLQAGEMAVRPFPRWLVMLAVAAVRGRTTLAINAGEFSLTRPYAVRSFAMLPVIGLLRLRGGKVVWLGSGIPNAGVGAYRPIFRLLAHSTNLLKWRSSGSSELMIDAPWMPDWAFAVEPRPESGVARSTLGVSLRFDRPYPSEEWLGAVRDVARRLDLEVVAVAQVERDSPYAERLAHDLGGRAVVFTEGSHAEQEAKVRAEYSAMSMMLSDRLHGLIMAATEGAIPLGWCLTASDKIARHLDPAGLGFSSVPKGSEVQAIDRLDADQVSELQMATNDAVERARKELRVVAGEVASL